MAGVILAAGRGTRMGSTKQLVALDGRPVLQHVVDAACAGSLQPLVLVLGYEAEAVAAGLVLPPGAEVVVNPRYEAGQSTSLRAGLEAVGDRAGAAVILLGDQPEVRPDAIRALVAASQEGGAPLMRAAYRGRASHPVVLGRAVWPEAMALRGDAGARALIASHAGAVRLVEVGGDPPEDVDTPQDLARLRERLLTPPGG